MSEKREIQIGDVVVAQDSRGRIFRGKYLGEADPVPADDNEITLSQKSIDRLLATKIRPSGSWGKFGYTTSASDATAKLSLKDRLALVNAGDTLTVVDTRGDVWTGVVREGPYSAGGLVYGPGCGQPLRFDCIAGETVADIRDHVPAVKTTPEPTKVCAVVRDANGIVVRSRGKGTDAAMRWSGVSDNALGAVWRYSALAQPVEVLFEGIE